MSWASRGAVAAGGLTLAVAAWTALPSRSVAPSILEDVGSTSSAPLPTRGSFEQDGIEVELLARGGKGDGVRAWEDADLAFAVTTSGAGGGPVRGLQPLAWLLRRGEGESALDRGGCERKLRALTAGRLAIDADVNLNEYHLVTLDENASLSIIDPQVGSSLTKTLGIISLPSAGEDFVLAPDRRTVVVTLPGSNRVALADLHERAARYIDVDGSPRTVSIQPDGRYAWITFHDREAVDVIDVVARRLAGTVELSSSLGSDVAASVGFREDSRYAFVALQRTLSVVDVHTLERVAQLDLGGESAAVAASGHSGRVYVARRDGVVLAIDDERHHEVSRMKLESTVRDLRAAPGGRWLFALGDGDVVSIVDTATGTLRARVEAEAGARRVIFSDTFAYVLHEESAHALLIDLATLAEGGPPVVSRVVTGQSPPVKTSSSSAPLAAGLPEGGGLLVLNEGDRSIYHLMEGMSAPMGSYRTYPWPARGVLLVDNTLREAQPGVYATRFRAPRPGSYTVAFLVPRDPQVFGCLNLEVEEGAAAPGGSAAPELRVSLSSSGREARPGVAHRLELLLEDRSGAGVEVEDLMLLALRPPRFQWRGAARPLGGGRYEIEVRFPRPGPYQLLVASASHGLAYGDLPSLPVTVPPADPSANRQEEAP